MEYAPWGKHWWLSQPGLTDTKQLTLVRVRMRPGAGHQFHFHPALEEIIYVVEGVAEQWVDREKRRLKAGEIAFIPKGVVHAIHNPSTRPMTFLAVLSPAQAKVRFSSTATTTNRGAASASRSRIAPWIPRPAAHELQGPRGARAVEDDDEDSIERPRLERALGRRTPGCRLLFRSRVTVMALPHQATRMPN